MVYLSRQQAGAFLCYVWTRHLGHSGQELARQMDEEQKRGYGSKSYGGRTGEHIFSGIPWFQDFLLGIRIQNGGNDESKF